MKVIKKGILASLITLSLNCYSKEDQTVTEIHLLVAVEPALVEFYGSEYLNRIVEENTARANAIFNPEKVNYKVNAIVVWSENLSEQVDFIGTGYTHLFYSIGLTETEYSQLFDKNMFPYTTKINELLKKYSADQLVYLSKFSGYTGIGASYRNRGFVHQFKALLNNPFSFAHELGHTWAIPHPKDCATASNNLLMCQSKHSNQSNGFTSSEKLQIKQIRAYDFSSLQSDLNTIDRLFWNGQYSGSMDILASAKITVVDNPIPEGINQTQVLVELVDDVGARTIVDQPVSVEVFFEGRIGIQESDYKLDEFGNFVIPTFFVENKFERIEFLPGESLKKVSLNVTHQLEQTKVKVGSRYGENITSNNYVNVVINSKPDSEKEESKGGSFCQLGLIFSMFLMLFRRRYKS